jgi:hypothetical protein
MRKLAVALGAAVLVTLALVAAALHGSAPGAARDALGALAIVPYVF